MKKYLALFLALCMLLALAACGEPSEPAGSSEPPADSGEPVSEEPVEAELDIMMSFPQFMDQWETYCKQFEEKMLAEENIKLTKQVVEYAHDHGVVVEGELGRLAGIEDAVNVSDIDAS